MADYQTLVDVVKSTDEHGNLLDVAELLETRGVANFIKDCPMVKGNQRDGMAGTRRTGEPTVSTRLINQGTEPSKSEKKKHVDTVSIYEARSHLDKEEALLYTDLGRARLSESKAFLNRMSKEVATDFIYGATPGKIRGVAVRAEFNALGTGYVVNGGFATNNGTALSIWLMGFSEDTVGMFYGENQIGGLEHDSGSEPETVTDASGRPYKAYVDVYTWRVGGFVTDPRYVVRIANINPAMTTGLDDLLAEAYENLPSMEGINPVFYVPKQLKIAFNKLAKDKSNHFFGVGERFGKPCTAFWEIPIVRNDVLVGENLLV